MDRDGQQEFHQHMLNLQEQIELNDWLESVDNLFKTLPEPQPEDFNDAR